MLYAVTIALADDDSSINEGILNYIKGKNFNSIKNVKGFIPANSERKRATILVNDDKNDIVISLGAPQVIKSLCENNEKLSEEYDNDVTKLAESGYRTVAVSIIKSENPIAKVEEANMKLVGILALSDEIRNDAKETVKFLKQNGINISIVTGDHEAIAREVAIKTGILNNERTLIRKDGEIEPNSLDKKTLLNTAAFSETSPGDKAEIIKQAQKYFTVASNGDGINDLPALMTADVGIAVQNAVPALKSTADIVLSSNGISIIKDAIIESRKIFQRLYGYSMYRISESFRLIVTITILGILKGVFPLTPIQLILIAILNDLPIISLAFDKTESAKRPTEIDAKKRFIMSCGFGLIGVLNSMLLYAICLYYLGFTWEMVQTTFFLKLTVSGHLLIFVTHTKRRWYKFLPSKIIIYSIFITQGLATILALTGIFMPVKLPLIWVVIIWLWSIFWMQINEIVKIIFKDEYIEK